MRKLFIFFIAFWVSFMTIYSIYYYKVKSKLDSSVVAMTNDLPHTVFGFEGLSDSDKNMIFTEGLGQIMPSLSKYYDSLLSPAPDTDFVSFNDHIPNLILKNSTKALLLNFRTILLSSSKI